MIKRDGIGGYDPESSTSTDNDAPNVFALSQIYAEVLSLMICIAACSAGASPSSTAHYESDVMSLK